jgi:hypothetical protein
MACRRLGRSPSTERQPRFPASAEGKALQLVNLFRDIPSDLKGEWVEWTNPDGDTLWLAVFYTGRK